MNKISPDFAAALKAAGLKDFFAGCTANHQREYLKWIDEAKKPETRAARIQKSTQMISAKQAQEAGGEKRR
ncbi:MAG: Bacteriocin-protection, YdeI or OmpD-Associated [Verrucomicrobiota bacterium]|jgi:uncharacterized protein YdeI (YjbR/CyaY-like superfamily)